MECTNKECTPYLVNCIEASKNEVTWKSFMDDSSDFNGFRINVIIMDNGQNIHEYPFYVSFSVTNNVEYKVTIFRLIIARMLGADNLILINDSSWVINQYIGIFEAIDYKMRKYL